VPSQEPDDPETLAQVFWNAWAEGGARPPAASPRVSPGVAPGLGERLLAALDVGRSTWPTIGLGARTFVAHLGRLVGLGGGASEQDPLASERAADTLASLHIGDLYLACACAAGLPRALELFEARYLTPLPQILRGLAVPTDTVEEVKESLRDKLLVAGADHPPRIAAYAGRGPLAAWVASAAQRAALSLRRGAGAQQRAHERAVRDAIAAELDPELRYVKLRYQKAFETAFSDALSELPDRDRTLLRLSLVGRLSLDALGVSYNVNASTVSRWLGKIRRQILDGTMARLRERLQLTTTEVASLARLLTSQLDVSVLRLLDPEGSGRPDATR
jgi:RNA polymerase sigma-70 factor, ECF subfamily